MEKYKRLLTEDSLDTIIKRHINAYSIADEPDEVAEEIGKRYNWSKSQILKAEMIIRKK